MSALFLCSQPGIVDCHLFFFLVNLTFLSPLRPIPDRKKLRLVSAGSGGSLKRSLVLQGADPTQSSETDDVDLVEELQKLQYVTPQSKFHSELMMRLMKR